MFGIPVSVLGQAVSPDPFLPSPPPFSHVMTIRSRKGSGYETTPHHRYNGFCCASSCSVQCASLILLRPMCLQHPLYLCCARSVQCSVWPLRPCSVLSPHMLQFQYDTSQILEALQHVFLCSGSPQLTQLSDKVVAQMYS